MLYHLFRTLKYWIISAVKLSTRGSFHIFRKSHDWESNIVTEKGEESLRISPLPIMPYKLEKQTISGLIAFKFARIICAVFVQSVQGNNYAIVYLETRLRKMLTICRFASFSTPRLFFTKRVVCLSLCCICQQFNIRIKRYSVTLLKGRQEGRIKALRQRLNKVRYTEAVCYLKSV